MPSTNISGTMDPRTPHEIRALLLFNIASLLIASTWRLGASSTPPSHLSFQFFTIKFLMNCTLNYAQRAWHCDRRFVKSGING
jgi:hypothetical protein